jgi:hypothetical protein
MEAELYLRSIDQEMLSEALSAGSPSPDLRPPNWRVSWKKSCCVIDFSAVRPAGPLVESATEGLVMRSEPDGGLAWDPATKAVFKVDPEGYEALDALAAGLTVQETASRLDVPVEVVSRFIEDLSSLRESLL